MPVRVVVTAGPVADCTQADELSKRIEAQCLLADKGYDTSAIVAKAQEAGMLAVIPPRTNRKQSRDYDDYLYKLRHLVEDAFMRLKQRRGIATRHGKRSTFYLADVRFRCAIPWEEIS